MGVKYHRCNKTVEKMRGVSIRGDLRGRSRLFSLFWDLFRLTGPMALERCAKRAPIYIQLWSSKIIQAWTCPNKTNVVPQPRHTHLTVDLVLEGQRFLTWAIPGHWWQMIAWSIFNKWCPCPSLFYTCTCLVSCIHGLRQWRSSGYMICFPKSRSSYSACWVADFVTKCFVECIYCYKLYRLTVLQRKMHFGYWHYLVPSWFHMNLHIGGWLSILGSTST